MKPNIEEIREKVINNQLTVLERTEVLDALNYIDELENMPLVQTVLKLQEALQSVRTRLGDFQEPWNGREREIDEIARKALEGSNK